MNSVQCIGIGIAIAIEHWIAIAIAIAIEDDVIGILLFAFLVFYSTLGRRHLNASNGSCRQIEGPDHSGPVQTIPIDFNRSKVNRSPSIPFPLLAYLLSKSAGHLCNHHHHRTLANKPKPIRLREIFQQIKIKINSF